MRLYRRIQPLNEGVTASTNNKGLLVCNPGASAASRTINVNVLNYDNTISGLTLSAYGGPSTVNQIASNYILLPFTITSWTNTSGVSLNGFELF